MTTNIIDNATFKAWLVAYCHRQGMTQDQVLTKLAEPTGYAMHTLRNIAQGRPTSQRTFAAIRNAIQTIGA